jgi:DNA-binding NarL/FixJ family response regulator
MEPSTARTAVILDQHPLWLEALVPILQKIDVEVVGKATQRNAALALVDENRPDLFIAEISGAAGTAGGLTCLRQVRERAPGTKLIVLDASASTADIDAAFAAGATVYIVKTAYPEDIASTIRQAYAHSVFFAQPTASRASESREVVTGTAPAEDPGLTRRETQILQLVAEGHSNGQLARMLWVTEQTVKFHLSNIYRKLDVRNRTEASRWAQLNGLVPATRTVSTA